VAGEEKRDKREEGRLRDCEKRIQAGTKGVAEVKQTRRAFPCPASTLR
jgi:hypothetical protein